jgi:hypothetical protein
MLAVESPPDRSIQLMKRPNGGSTAKVTDNIPFDAPADGAPVELAYYVQDKRMREAPMAATFMHVVFTVRLLANRSIIFGVPLGHFTKGYTVSMPFNYEFELNERNVMPGLQDTVSHSVYFFNEDLPKELLRKVN